MSKSEVSEQALLDDFFRQGDAFSVTAATLEPPMGREGESSSDCDSLGSLTLRSVEQEARRQRYARQISVAMAVLALGTAVAVVGHLGSNSRATAAPTGVKGFGETERAARSIEPTERHADPSRLAAAVPVATGQESEAAPSTELEVVTRPAVVTPPALAMPPGSAAGEVSRSIERGLSVKASTVSSSATARKAASTSVGKAQPLASQSARRTATPAASGRSRDAKNIGSGSVQSVSTATARARSTDYRPPTASFAD